MWTLPLKKTATSSKVQQRWLWISRKADINGLKWLRVTKLYDFWFFFQPFSNVISKGKQRAALCTLNVSLYLTSDTQRYTLIWSGSSQKQRFIMLWFWKTQDEENFVLELSWQKKIQKKQLLRPSESTQVNQHI